MNNLRPNKERAQLAIALIIVVLVIDLVSLVSSYLQYDMLLSAANGGDISTETAENNDLREQIIGVLQVLVFGASGVTFIMWFRRAYYNLHQLEDYLLFSEGWAAGAWFVPLVNLFRPYQIMDEMYSKTRFLLGNDGNQLSSRFLGPWWALWVICNIINQAISRFSLKAETIDELQNSTIADMVATCLGIPLAIITIKIIADYAKVEPLLQSPKTDDELFSYTTTQE